VGKVVTEGLHSGGILEMQEGVIVALARQAFGTQTLRQPLSPVEVDWQIKREPTLQAHVHETKLSIQEVQVKMQTLPLLARDHQFLGGALTLHDKRLARFDDRKNTDQPFRDVVSFSNCPRQVFFGLATGFRRGRLQVLIRPLGGGGQLRDMGLQFRRGLLDEATEVLEQHSVRIQKACKRTVGKQVAQVAAEDQPVKHGQRAFDSIGVDLQKVVHGSSLRHARGSGRVVAVQSSPDNRSRYYAIETGRKVTFWLRPEAAL
jgi:hypothetical protein